MGSGLMGVVLFRGILSISELESGAKLIWYDKTVNSLLKRMQKLDLVRGDAEADNVTCEKY